MPCTQHTIHSGISLRGAQLHTVIYSSRSVSIYVRVLCVHIYVYANSACMHTGVGQNNLAPREDFANAARKPGHSRLNADLRHNE